MPPPFPHTPASRTSPDVARPRTAACAISLPGSQHPHHSGTQLEAYVRRNCPACQMTVVVLDPSWLGGTLLGCDGSGGFGPSTATGGEGALSEPNMGPASGPAMLPVTGPAMGPAMGPGTGPARSRSCQQPDS